MGTAWLVVAVTRNLIPSTYHVHEGCKAEVKTLNYGNAVKKQRHVSDMCQCLLVEITSPLEPRAKVNHWAFTKVHDTSVRTWQAPL